VLVLKGFFPDPTLKLGHGINEEPLNIVYMIERAVKRY
jgi:hypothetical protein